MSIDINFYQEAYFTFDKPVPYKLKCGKELYILPISLSDSVLFLTSYGILDIDKNSASDAEIISMPYLKFLAKRVLPFSDLPKQQLINICILCLGFKYPSLKIDEKDKVYLCDINKETDEENFRISSKEFDDIKRIILYQNLPNFDDSYINPELKERMKEVDELKNKNLETPSLERRIAIITSHCGISKSEQLSMSFRAHSILFQEVNNEVEYMCTKPIAVYGGKAEEVQWIFKKKKDKFSDYITSVEDYSKSMGGNDSIKTVYSK